MLPHPAVVRAIKPEAYGISTFSLEYTDSGRAARLLLRDSST